MTVELLPPDAAGDGALVDELAGVINAAYAVGERDLWAESTTRTDAAQVADGIRAGGMLAARLGRRIVGCARVRAIDARTAELGLVSAAPGDWGGGIGRELVRAAEQLARSRGATTMQLELLVPVTGIHPDKARLRAWYERLGYRLAGSKPFEGPGLAAACEFLIFRRDTA